MDRFAWKLCLFLFWAAVFSGRANELATLVGAATGTMLSWPLYRRLLPERLPESKRRRAEGGLS